jgi:hypothetical protein
MHSVTRRCQCVQRQRVKGIVYHTTAGYGSIGLTGMTNRAMLSQRWGRLSGMGAFRMPVRQDGPCNLGLDGLESMFGLEDGVQT